MLLLKMIKLFSLDYGTHLIQNFYNYFSKQSATVSFEISEEIFTILSIFNMANKDDLNCYTTA